MSDRPDWRPSFDARAAIHLTLTVVMGWLAIVLALPGDTFGTALSFRLMASLASEDVWAMLLWFIACIGVIGIFTPTRLVRLVSVLVLATMHGVLAGLLAVSNPLAWGSAFCAGFAGLGYYLAWRRAVEGL